LFEFDFDKKEQEEKELQKEATLEDIQKITFSRNKIEKLLQEPYFENVIKNVFVRLLLPNENSNSNEAIYR
jgi:hypothetical protein